MAGTSPAMTQTIEFKEDRHARPYAPYAGHPRDADGRAAFAEFTSFSAAG